MSASPATGPGGPAVIQRRRPAANPLITKKKQTKKPFSQRIPKAPAAHHTDANGDIQMGGVPANVPAPPEPKFISYPLYITGRQMRERAGLRFHSMRFHGKKVDLKDTTELPRPLRLHRRDPRATDPAVDTPTEQSLEEERERERQEVTRQEKKRIRDENAALIAPAAKAAARTSAFQKKTEQVFLANDTEEQRKRSQLRYEEALPWHLEDFEDKHVFTASYEAALSDRSLVVKKEHNGYRLVPVEKWYKFREKSKFQKYSLDTAEKVMSKNVKMPRWFMETQKANKLKEENEAAGRPKLYSRRGDPSEKRGITGEFDKPETAEDADDIDFDVEEMFADDEENPIFDADEDTAKAAEDKIKRERLEANVFDKNDEKEVDKEDQQAELERRLQKEFEKQTRKAIVKRERDYNYERDDSDENPYSSSSESDDSETERLKEEQRKKEEDAKATIDKDKQKSKDVESKVVSGASSKGNNTPSGRPKHLSSSLINKKQPNSPNLSEASGNESSRKKPKKFRSEANGSDLSQKKTKLGKTGQLPVSSSRQASGNLAGQKRNAAGSGSENDASDGGYGGAKRLKMNFQASPVTSPTGSRAGSPGVGNVGSGGSRAGSPTASQAARKPSTKPSNVLTAAEIRAAIPSEGIPLKDLLAVFKHKVGDQKAFIEMVKQNAKYDKRSRMLHLNDNISTSANT
ncbi:hypothetical protein K402DRAFT_52238 [Aulographum hederae CBS 113979]|uniref:Uncharacterized protein n=1 Tax=Aulographum hederae CBS 113979 TaxID=1176131 RepID=A0A6G1H271_9PEZI|nr:hypothetical protein K402DRAFT_52238 [Aulographum hederae CBS 113979]